MKYYVRKITLSKFPKPPATSYDVSLIKADAVADIRTFKDKLSIWKIESNSQEEIDKAVLALVTSSKQERFDDFDIVIFSEDDITAKGLSLESEDGDTAVSELRETHQNFTGLTYQSLSCILTIISDITIKGQQIRIRKRQVETLIKNNFNKIALEWFEKDNIKVTIRQLAGISV